VGRKTGREEKAMLQERNMSCVVGVVLAGDNCKIVGRRWEELGLRL